MHSVEKIARPVRRRLQRIAQRCSDRDYVRRALAILALWKNGNCVTDAASQVCAARSTVNRWRALFEQYGEDGLKPQTRGRCDWKADEAILAKLESLLESSPADQGYLRSRWSSELLAKVLFEHTGVAVHGSTVRRWLARLSYGYRRARPTLFIRDPRKTQRMRAIRRALKNQSKDNEVLYVDEADVDLNPRIGPAWMPRGTQTAIATPGKNRKHYVAGALNARTGRVVWTEYERKNSTLFLGLLHRLRRTYRSARRITLIADNYIIHKSKVVKRWLAANKKFQILFQPAYHPWVNEIERLWKQMHDTVTRNHRCTTMAHLMTNVRRFLNVCRHFPGREPGLATRT